MPNDNFNTTTNHLPSSAPTRNNNHFSKSSKPHRTYSSSTKTNSSPYNNSNYHHRYYRHYHNNGISTAARSQSLPSSSKEKSNSDIFLSVVIPAYNEEKRLPQTLAILDNYLKKQPYRYEIIVVNDGSQDNTSRVTEELIGKIAKLKLLDNSLNHGKGYVVRQGLLAAKGKIRLFTDSDNSTPIEEVEKLLPFFKEGYDIVIGSRHASGAKLEPAQPPLRQFLGWGWRLLTNIIIGLWDIKDTQCGFKAFTAAAAQEILPLCRIDRFAFDPEILILAKAHGYRIKEVGITWKNDPRSTVKASSMVKMFKDLLRIRANQAQGLYQK